MAEKVGDATIRNIGQQRVKEESPGHWVGESFFQLIHLEMFVSDPLLVDSNTLHGKDSVLFGQPSGVQLVVRNHVEEVKSQYDREQSSYQENNLPWRNGGAVRGGPDGNAIGHESSEDLTETIETEPDTRPLALFLLRPPL